jgi:hypothetical protein
MPNVFTNITIGYISCLFPLGEFVDKEWGREKSPPCMIGYGLMIEKKSNINSIKIH